jgi:Bacteriophage baseplate protein W
MPKTFLGVGWHFPIDKDPDTGLKLAEYEESVRQAIWIILGTAKGERVMRPDFGCGIHDLVFGEGGPATAGRVSMDVREALLHWEPRIDVLDVQARPAGTGEVLHIHIDYSVRATNNAFNLVFPFYLDGSAG